jgi:regulator of replication initiation timing
VQDVVDKFPDVNDAQQLQQLAQLKSDNPVLYNRTAASNKFQSILYKHALQHNPEGYHDLVQQVHQSQNWGAGTTFQEARADTRYMAELINKNVTDDKERQEALQALAESNANAYGGTMQGTEEALATDKDMTFLSKAEKLGLAFYDDTNPELAKGFRNNIGIDPSHLQQQAANGKASPERVGYSEQKAQLASTGADLTLRVAQQHLAEYNKTIQDAAANYGLRMAKEKMDLESMQVDKTSQQSIDNYNKAVNQYNAHLQDYKNNSLTPDKLLTPEQQQDVAYYQKQYSDAIDLKDRIHNPNDKEYGLAAQFELDNIAQELTTQKRGFLSIEGNKFIKDVLVNPALSILSPIQQSYSSEENNKKMQLAFIGAQTNFENKTYVRQDNQPMQQFEMVLPADLEDKVNAVNEDDKLSDAQKREQIKGILAIDQRWYKQPIDQKFNLKGYGLLYGLGDATNAVFGFMAKQEMLGAGSNASKAQRILTTAANIGVTDYSNKLIENYKNNVPNPVADALVHTGINMAVFAGGDMAGAIEKVAPLRKMLGNTAAGEVLNKLSDQEILNIAKKAPSKYVNMGKALLESQQGNLHMTALGMGATIANDAASGKLQSPADYAKQGLLQYVTTLPISFLGIKGKYDELNEVQKHGWYDIAGKPEDYNKAADELVANGTLSPDAANAIKANIQKAADIHANTNYTYDDGKVMSDDAKAKLLLTRIQQGNLKEESRKNNSDKVTGKLKKEEAVTNEVANLLHANPDADALDKQQAALEKKRDAKDEDGKPLASDKEQEEYEIKLAAIKQYAAEAPKVKGEPEKITQPIELSTGLNKQNEKAVKQDEANGYLFADRPKQTFVDAGSKEEKEMIAKTEDWVKKRDSFINNLSDDTILETPDGKQYKVKNTGYGRVDIRDIESGNLVWRKNESAVFDQPLEKGFKIINHEKAPTEDNHQPTTESDQRVATEEESPVIAGLNQQIQPTEKEPTEVTNGTIHAISPISTDTTIQPEAAAPQGQENKSTVSGHPEPTGQGNAENGASFLKDLKKISDEQKAISGRIHLLAAHEGQMSESQKQELSQLRRQRDNNIRAMEAQLRSISARYGGKTDPEAFSRQDKQQWELLQRELQVGYATAAGIEHATGTTISPQGGDENKLGNSKRGRNERENAHKPTNEIENADRRSSAEQGVSSRDGNIGIQGEEGIKDAVGKGSRDKPLTSLEKAEKGDVAGRSSGIAENGRDGSGSSKSESSKDEIKPATDTDITALHQSLGDKAFSEVLDKAIEESKGEKSAFNADWVKQKLNKEANYTYTDGNSYVKNSAGKRNVLRATPDEIRSALSDAQKEELVKRYNAKLDSLKGNPYAEEAALNEASKYLGEINPAYEKLTAKGKEPFEDSLKYVIKKAINEPSHTATSTDNKQSTSTAAGESKTVISSESTGAGSTSTPQKESSPQAPPVSQTTGAEPTAAKPKPAGKYEAKARQVAEKIKASNIGLPDFLKADLPEGTKGAGYSAEDLKNALADAVIAVGKALDTGAALKEAIKEAVKDLVHMQGKENEENILHGFEQYYKDNFHEEEPTAAATATPDNDHTKIANAVNDAFIQGKFGVDALDTIIGKLQDTDEKRIYQTVKEKIQKGQINTANVRERVMTTKQGSEYDQAALLYDMAELKGKAKGLRQGIIDESDATKKAAMQQQLMEVQNEMLDNALANRLLGRSASTIFRIRQEWVDQEMNLDDFMEQYKAANGLKGLTPEQDKVVRDAYNKISALDDQRKQLKEDYDKAIEANTKLKAENDKVNAKLKEFEASTKKQKQADRAKKNDETIQKSNERIQQAKDELRKLRGGLNDVTRVAPKTAALVTRIAAEKFYQGAVRLSELVSNVLDEVKDVFPDWTEKEVIAHLFPDADAEKIYNNKQSFDLTKEEIKDKKDAYLKAEKDFALQMYEWEKDRRVDMMAQKPMKERIVDGILRWQRFAVLSYPTTMVKLAAVVGHQLTFKPLKFGFQYLVNKASGGALKGAGVWGKPELRALASYYSALIQNFSLSNLKEQFAGIDSKEVLYGRGLVYDEWAASKSLLDLPGRSHGYIKSFVKNPEFQFAHQQLVQQAMNNMAEIGNKLKDANLPEKEREALQAEYDQWDIANLDNLQRINELSLAHSKWAIMMNDNKFVDKFRQFADDKTALGAVLRSEMPVVKIPVNFVGRAFAYKYGLVKALTGAKWMVDKESRDNGNYTPSIFKVLLKGSKSITPEQSELLSKTLTLGSMGASFFVLGYAGANNIKENDDGSFELFGVHISKNLIHSPELESVISGASIANRMAEDKKSNFAAAMVHSDIDILKKNPFLTMLQYGFIPNVAQAMVDKRGTDESKWAIVKKAVADKVAGMVVPGFLKQPAQWLDTKEGAGLHPMGTPQDRKIPKDASGLETIWQSIELGVPLLRENVPLSGSFDREDYKDRTFKFFIDKGLELPNVSLSAEKVTDSEAGTQKSIAEYSPEVQKQYQQAHKEALKETLAQIQADKTVFVKPLKDAFGNDKSRVTIDEPKTGKYKEVAIDKLNKAQLAQLLSLAQKEATKMAKHKIFKTK